jgi:hypothetical protein
MIVYMRAQTHARGSTSHRGLMLSALLLMSAALMAFAPGAMAAGISSTDDPGQTLTDSYLTQQCAQGSSVNCNGYGDKRDVFLSGLPASLGPGTYFFAVLDPGGQQSPNDGTPGNLSCADPSGTCTGGTWDSRQFTIDSSGNITNSGSLYVDVSNGDVNISPFGDTNNAGGVYIVDVCQVPGSPTTGAGAPGVDPKGCKTDAFKVKSGAGTCTDSCPPVTVNSVFTGNKWLDPDADGVFQPTESGIYNWTIQVTDITDPSNPGAPVNVYTDSYGSWSWTTPDITVGTGARSYQICEVMQTGWNQTGPDSGGVDLAAASGTATGGVSATQVTSGGSACYDVSVPDTAVGTMGSLDFFNEPTGTLSGEKYFDANRSGVLDPGETGISGWEILLTGTAGPATSYSYIAHTGTGGTFTVPNLVPGTYTVSEVLPTNLCGTLTVNCWSQTGNTTTDSTFSYTGGVSASLSSKTYSVSASSPTAPWTVTGLDFGNVCLVSNGGGLTLGYWSNNNGQKILVPNWTAVATLINSTLYLVNANGSRFTVSTASSTGYKQLNTWLLSANSTNASYMLSAQMLTTEFDLKYGTMSNYLVKDPVTGNWVTISALITEASAFVQLNPNTTKTGTTRTQAVAYQTLFNALNNNQASVQATGSGGCPAPVFPS